MVDPDPDPEPTTGSEGADPGTAGEAGGDGEVTATEDADGLDPVSDLTEAELKERVEEKYDFEDFGPRDMEEMSLAEWEVVFDAESWITGRELLDRVADDLRSRIADREVFAVLEEVEEDGQPRLLAYSDEGYALVYPDGGVTGFGTVLRDVKPTVALCSMESYDPGDPPADDGALLPTPGEVPEGTGEFGNLMLQVVAAIQILAGLGLVGIFALPGTGPAAGGSVVALAAGIFFVLTGLFLFTTVANARLSDRFRVEEYRERLRAIGLDDGERPEFLPIEDGEVVDPPEEGARPVEAAPPEAVREEADRDAPDPAGDAGSDRTSGDGRSSGDPLEAGDAGE